MRTFSPDLRTLPSSTEATRSARAISAIGVSLPLYEKLEVRAITRSFGTLASRFSSSSVMPSEKYSFDFSSLMFTNGSTAMELSLASGATDAADGVEALGTAGVCASRDAAAGSTLRGTNRSNADSPIANTRRLMMMYSSRRLVMCVIEAERSTSLSRLRPSGVSS